MNANYSELHSRLNHLVNYSSQLLFVSSENIAEQHRTLEAFMAEQDEQTEIAFVTAQADEHPVSYRRQLCRQLIGQVAGSFTRPLNELLVSLNHYDGPVLIGITQAHHLPNSFLQELWDLVLQSRFAANKQHLNIVLFGNSQWAEEAQSWLPAKNTATPVLLSSESIDSVGTELEQLISQKRAAFQQRLADRQEQNGDFKNSVALIRKPWFSLMIIGIFSLFFATILGWQYPEKMQSLLGLNVADDKTVVPIETQVEPTNPLDKSALAAVEIETPAEATAPDDETIIMTTVDMAPTVEAIPEETSVTEQLLVSKWQTDESPTNDTDINQPISAQAKEIDIKVEPDIEETIADPPPVTNVDGLTLPALNDSRYLIQLAGLQDVNLALQFIEDQNLLDSVWLYKTQRYGGDWFVIVYKQAYDSFAEAQAGVTRLPDYQGLSTPFVKSSLQINAELNL